MERVSVARMATAKLQGGIHATRGMGVSGSAATELNRYNKTKSSSLAGEGRCLSGRLVLTFLSFCRFFVAGAKNYGGSDAAGDTTKVGEQIVPLGVTVDRGL